MASYNKAHEYKQRIEYLTKQREKIADMLALLSEMLELSEGNRDSFYTGMIRDLGAEDAELAVVLLRYERTLAELERMK